LQAHPAPGPAIPAKPNLRLDLLPGPRWIEELAAKLWRSPGRKAESAEPMADPAEEVAQPSPPRPSPGMSMAEVRAARAAWADRLWGLGACLPGGKEEVLRLASLLRLNPDTTLLLVGDGAAAAGAELARSRGTYVAAHDLDAERSTRAQPVMRNLKGRVTVAGWTPAAPSFRAGYHWHALLLEPARSGADPATLMRAVAAGLRQAGHLLLFELVLADGADDQDPMLRRWRRVDGRSALPPRESAVEAAIHAAGFELHVTEDCGARQVGAVLAAWQELVEELAAAETRPAPQAAAALVAEAEAWLLRLRLLRSGVLRLQRWHATKE
jgi:hypothetical protein